MSGRKVAIVTGAGSGIGLATARRLAADGFHVCMVARGVERLRAAAGAIGEGASAHPADLTDRRAIERVVAEAMAIGPLHALINNAGLGFNNTLDTPLDEAERIWDACHDNNLKSVFLTCAVAGPHVADGGAIVNVGSITARTGGSKPGWLAYAAAKAGVEGLTMALARELAARDVTVNVVQPGFVAETEQTRGFDAAAIAPTIPLGRAGKGEDIAGTIAWLVSGDARFVTGAIIPANGGWRFA